MTQYISKDAVVAEIERRISEVEQIDKASYEVGLLDAYKIILSFLDTLEVKDVQEEPVSNDLEEAAKKAGQKYFPDKDNIWARPNYEAMAAANAFKEGYHWKEEQCQKTIELAEDHAYLAGQEKMIDKACDWLADNYSKYITTNGLATIFSATIDFDTIRMIEDFKKSMGGINYATLSA